MAFDLDEYMKQLDNTGAVQTAPVQTVPAQTTPNNGGRKPFDLDEFMENNNTVQTVDTQPAKFDAGKFMQNAAQTIGNSANTLKGGISQAVNQPFSADNLVQAANALKGGVKYAALGGGNVVKDLGTGLYQGVTQGIPQFLGQLKKDTVQTTANAAKNPAETLKAIPPALLRGVDTGLYNLGEGVLSIPESIAASYNEREFNPDNALFHVNKPSAAVDMLANYAANKGLINGQKYQNWRQNIRQNMDKVPLASTLGELSLAALPVGKAAGLFGKKLPAFSANAAKKSSVIKDIGKAGAAGAGYGFAATPSNLNERGQSAGAGLGAGMLLGAGGKALQAGIKYGTPLAKYAGKEAVNRLNPANYETIYEAKPVTRGMGLSQRTVYEPQPKRVYSKDGRPDNAKNVTPETFTAAPEPGTGFVTRESSPLKGQPKRPSPKLLAKLEEIAPNTAQKLSAGIAAADNITPGSMVENAAKNPEINYVNKYLTDDGKKAIENFYKVHADYIEQEPEKYTGSRHPQDVLRYLGSIDGEKAHINTPVEDVTITKSNINHLSVDNEKERLENLNKTVSTLKNPNIVINAGKNKNNYHYYVKAFNSGDKPNAHLQIVKLKDDGNFYVTNYPLRNNQLEKMLIEGQVVYDLSSLTAPAANLESAPVNNSITNSGKNFNPDVKNGEGDMPPKKTARKYEDYGEKIEGARKDLWQSYTKALDTALPEKFDDVKLAKVFPEPDYKKMLENGAGEETLAVIKALRDNVSDKPRGRKAIIYGERWLKNLKTARELANKLIDGSMTTQEFAEMFKGSALSEQAELYTKLGYPAFTKAKGWVVADYSAYIGADYKYHKYDKTRWRGKNRQGSGSTEFFETKDEAINAMKERFLAETENPETKAPKEISFDIYRPYNSNEWFIGKKVKAYSPRLALTEGFKTAEEAREYLKEHKAELVEKFQKMGEIPNERNEVNRERAGEDYRQGEDVLPSVFADKFGFRGVQFGNYVEGKKRVSDVNNAYDAFMDLAKILDVPFKALSLNGGLGMAFGARGKGAVGRPAKAHYEPDKVVINLTKKQGAGSLAHEWWHALDNYLGNQNKKGLYITESTIKGESRQEVVDAIKELKEAVYNSDYYKRSNSLDRTKRNAYWGTITEMTARAFEKYAALKGQSMNISNDYLVNIKKFEAWKKETDNAYPYPTDKEMKDLSKIFDNFFDTLSTMETDKGVAFYNIADDIVNSGKRIVQNFKNFQEFNENLKQGKTIAELTQKGGELEELAEDLKEFGDYKIVKMSDTSGRNMGRHREKAKVIEINAEAIGNDISKFAGTLMHEIKHAEQIKEFNDILEHSGLTKTEQNTVRLYANAERVINESLINKLLNKGNFTKEQLAHIKNKRECTITNRELQKYCKKHENTLDKIWSATDGLDKYAKQEYINSLPSNVKQVYNEYRRLYQKYKATPFEAEAKDNGAEYAERVKNGNFSRRFRPMGIRGQRDVRTGYEDSSYKYKEKVSGDVEEAQRGKRTGQEDEIDWYSSFEEPAEKAEESNLKPKKTAAEYRPVIKNHIRKWNAGIAKDRYDVNKRLNEFTKDVDNIAKQNGLNSKNVREIMPFLRERTDFPPSLNRKDLKKVWDKAAKNSGLKAELTRLADNISNDMNEYYERYKAARIKNDDIEEPANIKYHISHDWKLKNKRQQGLLTTYVTTSSRFAKQRKIASWYDGIEGIKGDNGEIIKFTPNTLDYAELVKKSADSMIKAYHDKILADKIKKLKTKDGMKLVMMSSKAPSDWKRLDHYAIEFQHRIYREDLDDESPYTVRYEAAAVHPDVARTIETVFETQKEDGAFWKYYDNLNALMKQSELGFSGFHMFALSESAIANIGPKETVKILDPRKIWDEVIKGRWSIYKEDTLAKQALDDGLQIGATLDFDRNRIEKMLDNTEKALGKIPFAGKAAALPVKAVGGLNRLNNKVLWDYLHNNYKLKAYQMLINTQQDKLKRKLNDTERQEIAQFVNDSFGGQIWENLGIKQSEIKTAKRFFLSPDWLLSTTRQALAVFAKGVTNKPLAALAKKGTAGKLTKDVTDLLGITAQTNETAAIRGKLGLGFAIRAIIYSFIGYNLLNMATRAWDKKENPEYYPDNMSWKDFTLSGNSIGDKTYLFLNRAKDGKEMYVRVGKQFREIPESVMQPRKHFGNKAAPMVQLASTLMFGESMGGYKNRDMFENVYPYNTMKKGLPYTKAAAKVIAQQFVPFSLSNALNPDKEFSPASLFAPVSSGMSKYKAKEAYENAYKKTLNEKSDTFKKLDEEIKRSARMNNIDIKDIESAKKQARNNALKSYREEFVQAIQNHNLNDYDKVFEKMSKAGISLRVQEETAKKARELWEKTDFR